MASPPVRLLPALFVLFASLFTWSLLDRPAHAQMQIAPGQMPTEEQISKLPPEIQSKIRERMAKMRAGGGPPQPPKPEEPKKDDKPKEEKKDEKEKKDESAPVTKRPTEPPSPPNPEELKAAPDENGLVQFSFKGQPWKDVLQWYADVAGRSFDWQELPGDFLNLTTTRKHTLDETRDLLNRHLLARGFTMVSRGEVLSVFKIDKLDPSLIPRVEPDDLEDYMPHDFVRVRFKLPTGMEAEKAKEDVKVLLSPHAKVVPLLATRRLLVIDAVANLRDVRDLLYSEQMAESSYLKPREFILEHRDAEYIADQVMIVLGLDPASRKNPMELQLEQARLQLYTQMQQKGKDVSSLLQKDGPKVYIAVNRRRNSILVNAPPEVMPTIERTIKQLDQPDDAQFAGGPTAPGGDRLSMQSHKTITASVDSVVKALNEIARLDPRTQLQSDSKNNTIYAFATETDHAKIEEMIKQLDSPGRSVSVFWLRNLPADQVAGTINALLVGQEKKEDDNNSRRRRMFFFPFGQDEEEKKEAGFQALADLERNRLLVWANENELQQVRDLLVQLGESPSGEATNVSRTRVLDARNPQETELLLRRLEAAWGGKNKLRVRVMPQPPAAKPEPPAEEPKEDLEATEPAEDTVTRTPHRSSPFRLVSTAAEEKAEETAEEKPATEEPAPDQPAPIDIIITPDGRIVLRSDDTAALNDLEALIEQVAPANSEFAVFYLRNSSAYYVCYNLEEYFEDELKGQKEDVFDYWGDYAGSKRMQQGPTTLSARRKLRFIYDYDTNSIVVQNASAEQLRVIEQLVKIYDRPPGEEDIATRRTEVIKLRYSKAEDVATALKEVYRDLLSSKDKEFQGGENRQSGRTTTYYFRRSGGDDKEKKPKAVKVKFEGALSVGVDAISNTLIVSAQEEVWDSVREIVQRLDDAAKPDTVVRLHRVDGSVSADSLRAAVVQAMSAPWPGGKPASQSNAGNNRGNNNQNRGRNNRNNRGR